MALKFLNKKGWHTGSLRNIENVWKAEQKHAAEEKKLDELRRQIQEERERTEFRLLQEQAGLVPKQERLDFLYDSGLSVGKSDGGGGGGGGGAAASGSGFKALEQPFSSATASNKQQPGALFEDKPHSAGDTWRKLHSDPLLLIRQREQEALARVKNNPVKMALIRKSVEEKKHKHKSRDKRDRKKKHRKHSSSRQQQSDSDYSSSEGESPRKSKTHKTSHYDKPSVNDKNRYKDHSKYKYREPSPGDSVKRNHDRSKHENYPSQVDKRGRESDSNSFAATNPSESHHNRRRNGAPKLSEEERAARLREMQVNAELHEEHRWKRLRKAEEDDAREATRDGISRGSNFLDAAQKSVYGAEKGGSSTIEERVRRRTYYSQGRSEASEGNAFRR